ncbi:MAG: protein kinase [Polyangiales bacterium]
MDSSDRLATGALVGDDFVIEREIAHGGMGTVYLARQRSTGRARALKVLHPSLLDHEKSVERFLQEARIGAVFRSAHVVEVIAAGVHRELGTPWLAMELLEGETLAQRVARAGPMAWPEIAQLAAQLGDALGAAHAAGVVHRDIKPENLFLCASSTASFHWSLKVLDFGIAKVIQESRTSATATASIGTPLWMAPEQTDAHGQISAQTDVWSLALVLFWSHVGHPYWRAANTENTNLSAVLRELILDPIEPASVRAHALGAFVPTALDPWFARCWQRDPRARFAHGREACDALVAALHAMHEAPVSTPVAFAATTAMPAAIAAHDPAHTPLRPISNAPSPVAQTLAAQPPLASAQPSPRAPTTPLEPAREAPREEPREEKKSSAATRALWAVAALCTLVGLAAMGLGLYKRFEFVGLDSNDRPRAPRSPRTSAQPSSTTTVATNALAPNNTGAFTTPALAQPPAVAPQPAQITIPTIVERQRTHSDEDDSTCQALSNSTLSTAFDVATPPSTENEDDHDARQRGCRSAYALCRTHAEIPCPEYSVALGEGHSVWCCP